MEHAGAGGARRRRVAILGDSIAYGTGASREEDTIAGRLRALLAAEGVDVETRVAAEPGARSKNLARQVRNVETWRPDAALIVIGANDLTRLEPAHAAAEHLRDAVRALRAHGTQVVVAPAPDLSVLPYVPAALKELVRAGSERLRLLQQRAVEAEGGNVADQDASTAEAFGKDPGLYSTDLFHPSSRGYEVITEALHPHIRSALEAAEAERSEKAAGETTPPGEGRSS